MVKKKNGNGESERMHAELDEREVQQLRDQYSAVLKYLQRSSPHQNELARAFHTLGVCAVHLAQVLENNPKIEIMEDQEQDLE